MLTLSRGVFNRGSGGIQAPSEEQQKEKKQSCNVAVALSVEQEDEFSVVGTENETIEVREQGVARVEELERGGKMGAEA